MTHISAAAGDPRDARDPWARLRFSIVSPLLAMPLDRGDLRSHLKQRSQQLWKHPITGAPIRFAASSIERWYYTARDADDPIGVLRRRLRTDFGKSPRMSAEAQSALLDQYRDHPRWSQELHHDNLVARAKQDSALGRIPSTSTVGRFLRARGLYRRPKPKTDTEGARRSAARFERLEVRSYEVPYVGGLWHLDFHIGSRSVVTRMGASVRPVLLGILDDHSRLCCHLQWYLAESSENLVHGLCQALMKRGLPRALMTDNGSAMLAVETRNGLSELSIEHELTLCYAPYQNGKQESFWQSIEGRLLPMLDGEGSLGLDRLNDCTQMWVEQDYHRRVHSTLKVTPLKRLKESKKVLRQSPGDEALRRAFRRQVSRRQRGSDGSITVQGVRFDVPSAFSTLASLDLRYASWDLSQVDLIDPRTGVVLARLRPQDKVARAEGHRARRASSTTEPVALQERPEPGESALMKELLDRRHCGDILPLYMPKKEQDPAHEGDTQSNGENR